MKNVVYIIALFILCGAIVVCLYFASLLDVPARYACLGLAGMLASVVVGSLCLRILLQERQPVGLCDPPATVTISRSKTGSIVTTAMLAGMSASIYLMQMAELVNSTMVWVAFWLCTTLAAVSLLGARSATLRLSPSGLEYPLFRGGPISWSDIADATVVPLGSPFVVALHLRDAQKYVKRGLSTDPMYLAERFMAGTPFLLPAKLFRLAPSTLVEAVHCRIRTFGVPSGASQWSPTRIEPTLS